MKKASQKLSPLSVTEIILRGETAIIREALEAREKIDTLLAEREAAYKRIAELESQVEEIVGEEANFPFPAPPVPVAEFPATKSPAKKAARKAPVAKEGDGVEATGSTEKKSDGDGERKPEGSGESRSS